MTIGWVWMYIEVFETKCIPLEEMGAKFGDEDGVVVRLSDAMAEAHSKPNEIDSKSSQVEKEQTSLEHLEYSDEATAMREMK